MSNLRSNGSPYQQQIRSLYESFNNFARRVLPIIGEKKMSETSEVKNSRQSLIQTFGQQYGISETRVLETLKNTAFKQSQGKAITDEQMIALLVVANEYKLNPFTREIYAFAANGGINPIVPIDGWMKIMNSHPMMDGITFEDTFDDKGGIQAVKCSIYRKDRKHPAEVTEYLAECQRPTEPWKKWPARMLRHKAAIQCARYAFSLSGISDPDEGERIQEGVTEAVAEPKAPEEYAVSNDDKEFFDQIISEDDHLEMFVFQSTIPARLFTNLYHSFPKGEKGKWQRVVDEMLTKGRETFRQYVDNYGAASASGDNAGMDEISDEVSMSALEMIKAECGEQ